MKAIWNDAVIAQSHETVVVEGNHYFPRAGLNAAYFLPSDTTSRCPWKGTANYLSIKVDGKTNTDAAWYYSSPKPAASEIKDKVAFWKGVQISD